MVCFLFACLVLFILVLQMLISAESIHRLSADGQDFFTSYDEVTETFDAMGLLENLLRGIYAYGKSRLQYIGRSYCFKRLFVL